MTILNEVTQGKESHFLSSCLAKSSTWDHFSSEEQIPSASNCCSLVKDFLSEKECLNLIQYSNSIQYTKASPAYPPSYRNNDRLVIDDAKFASELFQRAYNFLPHQIVDPDGARWQLVGINERFRFCRYKAGQFFKIHRDGVYYQNDAIQSKLTFMVYLNGGEDFGGGLTRFFESRDPTSKIITAITPQQGALVYFNHDLWHDGQELLHGEKFIMRSDILYERVSFPAHNELKDTLQNSHSGYIWASTKTSETTFATGGRDKTIKIWNRTPKKVSLLETLHGHKNSVTALVGVGRTELWSGSRDQTIMIWKTEDGFQYKYDQCLDCHTGTILSLAVNSEAEIVASSSADQSICLWNRKGICTNILSGHKDWVWCVRFLTVSMLLSACIRGWNYATLERKRRQVFGYIL